MWLRPLYLYLQAKERSKINPMTKTAKENIWPHINKIINLPDIWFGQKEIFDNISKSKEVQKMKITIYNIYIYFPILYKEKIEIPHSSIHSSN